MTEPTPTEVARAMRDGYGTTAEADAARALHAEQRDPSTLALAAAIRDAGRC